MTLEIIGVLFIGMCIGCGVGIGYCRWYLDYLFTKYAGTGRCFRRNSKLYAITEINTQR